MHFKVWLENTWTEIDQIADPWQRMAAILNAVPPAMRDNSFFFIKFLNTLSEMNLTGSDADTVGAIMDNPSKKVGRQWVKQPFRWVEFESWFKEALSGKDQS